MAQVQGRCARLRATDVILVVLRGDGNDVNGFEWDCGLGEVWLVMAVGSLDF